MNGERPHLTIEVLDSNPSGNAFFYPISSIGNQQSLWIGLVGNE